MIKLFCTKRCWLGAVLFLGLSSLVHADELTLSLDQVLKVFYQRNLDIIAAEYNIDQARAQEIIAAAIPNPSFTFDIEQLSARNNDRLGPFYSFTVSQLIKTAGKRSLTIDSSRLGASAAENDLQDAIRVLSNSVRKAYFNLLLAQKTAEVAKENKEHYQELVEINRLRLNKGDIAEADFLRIEVERLKAESDWNTANASVKAARSDLAKMLAWPDNALDINAAAHWPMAEALVKNTSQDDLIKKALDLRPDIAAARTRIEQAEKNLQLARKQAIPDVTVGLGYNHDPQNTQSDFAGVNFSVPLPVFYQQQGEISQANTGLNTAKLALEQTEQQLKTEVVSALAKFEAATTVVNRFEKEILGKTDQIRTAAELSYNKGATSIIELIEAERIYKSVQLDYYTALNNRTLTYADLQMAIGEK